MVRKWIYILVLAPFISGCNGRISPDRVPVRLCADVSGMGMDTKAPFTGVPSDGNEFEVSAWFSYEPGIYPDDPKIPQNLPNRIEFTFDSGSAVDVRDDNGLLYYPIPADENYNANKKNIYCTGFHPKDGWNIDDKGSTYVVSHAIDGATDLMFSDLMKGSYENNYEEFMFEHLLTWISFNASVTSSDAADIWGTITSVQITTPKNSLQITLSNDLNNGSTIEYLGVPQDVQVVSGGDIPLSVKAVKVGDALCSPPQKNPENEQEYGYKVVVATSKVGSKEIFVPLYDTDNEKITEPVEAIGKLFAISLYFNEVSVVQGVCTMKYWEDVTEDLYMEEQNQNQ